MRGRGVDKIKQHRQDSLNDNVLTLDGGGVEYTVTEGISPSVPDYSTSWLNIYFFLAIYLHTLLHLDLLVSHNGASGKQLNTSGVIHNVFI